jgi:hypothetical protein
MEDGALFLLGQDVLRGMRQRRLGKIGTDHSALSCWTSASSNEDHNK